MRTSNEEKIVAIAKISGIEKVEDVQLVRKSKKLMMIC